MKDLWSKILIVVFDAILIWFVWGTVYYGEYYITALTVLILITFNYIFLKPSAYPFRYMFPGLICFFLFLILPIIFTVYVAFTNLGTGHLLEVNNVRELLLGEKYLDEDSEIFKVAIGSSGDRELILLKSGESETLIGALPNSFDKKQLLKLKTVQVNLDSYVKTQRIELVSRGALFKMGKKLANLELGLPDGTVLSSTGRAKFGRFKRRFNDDGFGNLKELTSGNLYKADLITGFFSDGESTLSPGFRTNVGFKNFSRLFNDANIAAPFAKVFVWTFVWALCTVAFSFTVGLSLALILNKKELQFKPFYRILLIVPYSIPFFISVLIFKGLLNKDFGVINQILYPLIGMNIPWLEDPTVAKISCLMVNLWLGFPYMLLVLTGILQAIPEDLYEAAKLDGASKWITLKRITMPYIMSAIGPLLVGSFAFNFNNFVGIYLLTGGLPPMENVSTPAGETDILISYTYRLAFEGGQGQDFGLASAIAIFIFIIIAVITLINFKISGVFDKEASS